MDRHVQAALLRQQLGQLCAIREPDEIENWQPTEEQRAVYATLIRNILMGIYSYRSAETQELISEGNVQSTVAASAGAFFRNQLDPNVPALERAYEIVDPDGLLLLQLFRDVRMPAGARGRVRATFEAGVLKVDELVEQLPDQDFDYFPDKAFQVLDSELIAFEPDHWLDRAATLAPIRTVQANFRLPVHVRLRLEEIFRCYVFGCWLSVCTLARALLEYTILDNLSKFGIDTKCPAGRNGRRREKNLEQLINDIAQHLPSLREPMNRLRKYGNKYVHPKRSRSSKEQFFGQAKDAKDALETVIAVAETLYAEAAPSAEART